MMQNPFKILNWASLCSAVCAGAMAVLTALIMTGWIMHDSAVIHVMLPFTPMQFNPALCFLLFSVAFLGLRHAPHFSLLASASGALIALLTLSQYILQNNTGIDTLFLNPFIIVNEGNPGRMAANTALGLLLCGIALIYCAGGSRLNYRRALMAALIGSLVITVGAVPLLGHVFDLKTAYDLGTFARTSVYSELCFALLGIIIISYAWRWTDSTQYWLPIPVFICIIVVSYFMSEAIQKQEEIEFSEMLQVEVNHITQDAELHLINFYSALDRIANRWEAAGGTPYSLWQSDAKAYLHDFPYLAALSRTDTDARVEWLAPLEHNQKTIGFKVDSESKRAEAVKLAVASHAGQTTKIVELLNGGKGFLYLIPLYSTGQYQGLQIAVMRVQPIFDAILDRSNIQNFYVTVAEESPFYSTLPNGQEHLQQWQKSSIIHNKNTQWVVTISPTPALLATKNSLIPLAVLAVGFLCAILVTISIILMLKWRDYAEVLHLREAALEEKTKEQMKLISIIEESSDFIGVADLEGNLQYHNRSARRMVGYSADQDLTHLRIADMHPEWAVKHIVEHALPATFQQGSWQGESAILHRDGHEIPVLQNILLLRNLQGEPIGFTTIMRDISERKEAETALKASEEQFRSAMEHASIGMALVSPEGKWLNVNKRLCDLVGYTKEELLDADFQQITHPEDLKGDLELVRRMLAREIQTYQLEKRYFHKDGHILWILLSVSLVWDANNKPRYFISQIQDISARKEIEKMKNEFISTVSHELRTPLTSIRGSLGLLLGGVAGKLEEKSKNLIDIAYKNCERLVLLINDILDLEKIESGQMQFEMRPENLKGIIDNALTLNQAYGDKYNIRFIPQEPLQSGIVLVDSSRLLQVMANLLSNAAKFSPPGSIVEISTVKTTTHIRVCIKDHGPGIPTEFKSRIFQKFAQADGSDSRQKGGTGLGLMITRTIIEHMGGTINFSTKIGEGTTFYFDLPLQRDKVSPNLIRQISSRPRILICEDDHDIAHLLSITLDNAGYDTDISYNASMAMDYIASGTMYAAMTLDIMLPDKDGFTFLQELREQKPELTMPVIIVSARAEEASGKLDGLAMGVVDYLKKPIDIERLLRDVRSIVSTPDKPAILHIEDDEDIVSVLAYGIKDIASVTHASSLMEAKKLLQENIFDLIVLDIGLPDGSGLEVLDILKQNGSSIPVIIFSADEVPEEVSRKVAATLIKSKNSGNNIISTITTLISKMRKLDSL